MNAQGMEAAWPRPAIAGGYGAGSIHDSPVHQDAQNL